MSPKVVPRVNSFHVNTRDKQLDDGSPHGVYFGNQQDFPGLDATQHRMHPGPPYHTLKNIASPSSAIVGV